MSFLETRKIGVAKIAVMHVQPAEFRASCKRRHCLARIQQPLRIERRLDGAESFELDGRELRAHAAQLLDADAMLAGDGAAHLDAQRKDLIAECDGPFRIAGLVLCPGT